MAGTLGFGAVASAAVAGSATFGVVATITSGGNLGFGAVGSTAVAAGSGGISVVRPVTPAAGNLGFGTVASAAVAGNTTTTALPPTQISGNLGFGAVASTAVSNRSPSPLVTVLYPGTVAIASAGALTNASFIAAGSGGPVRASQVVQEVLIPAASTTKLRPFLWVNT